MLLWLEPRCNLTKLIVLEELLESCQLTTMCMCDINYLLIIFLFDDVGSELEQFVSKPSRSGPVLPQDQPGSDAFLQVSSLFVQ